MILTLVRETTIEVPNQPKKTIDRLPIITADSMEAIDDYCNSKSFLKVSGSGIDSIYQRSIDLKDFKKDLQSFFQTTIPMKLSERFAIFETALRSKS